MLTVGCADGGVAVADGGLGLGGEAAGVAEAAVVGRAEVGLVHEVVEGDVERAEQAPDPRLAVAGEDLVHVLGDLEAAGTAVCKDDR